MRLYKLEFINVNFYLTKFVAIDTDKEDVMILACPVISQDYLIKESCDFIGISPSRQFIILPNLVVIGTVAVEI